MRKLLSLLLICTFFSSFTYAQGLQIAGLPAVVNGIAAHNVYESETVGIANAKSMQFVRYQQLVTIATEEQLLALAAENANAVVRLYAYQALVERKIKIPKSLHQKFKADETKVNALEGCIANQYTVSQLAATPLSAKSNYSRQNFGQMQLVSQ